jgi:hypothetical protein
VADRRAGGVERLTDLDERRIVASTLGRLADDGTSIPASMRQVGEALPDPAPVHKPWIIRSGWRNARRLGAHDVDLLGDRHDHEKSPSTCAEGPFSIEPRGLYNLA